MGKGDGLWTIALRLLLALLFGAVLGCERAAKRHAAGLRTFVLVCLSGTAAMTLDRAIGSLPVISAAVVLGIAIISTNSILFSSKSQIRGLTTATGLWSCSLLGLALGAGLYTLALLGFAAILACLSWLPAFETYLKDRSNHFELHLELKSKYNLQDFVTTIRRLGLKIDDIEANPAYRIRDSASTPSPSPSAARSSKSTKPTRKSSRRCGAWIISTISESFETTQTPAAGGVRRRAFFLENVLKNDLHNYFKNGCLCPEMVERT